MNDIAPHSVAKPEVPLPPYDSLPPPPYAFSSAPPQPSPGYGGYYLQQYPPPGYDHGSSAPRHMYPPPGAYHQNQPQPPGAYVHQSQPQGGLVVIGEMPVVYKPVQTFYAHVAFACIVTWICNPLFGLISLMLAILAHSAASSGNEEDARRLGQASLGISLAGILVMVVLVIVFIAIAMA